MFISRCAFKNLVIRHHQGSAINILQWSCQRSFSVGRKSLSLQENVSQEGGGSSLKDMSPSMQRLFITLEKHDFLPKQIGDVVVHMTKLESRGNCKVDVGVIKEAISYWIATMKLPALYPDELQDIGKKFDYRTTSVQHVISHVDPDLLLVCPDAMESRLEKLKNIGFISGQRDIWRVFVLAPRAYFLQDWGEFLRKYHYMQHRLLDWLLDKRNKMVVPHPFVKHPRVFELSYEHIKARHLFAERTGFKSTSITTKLEKLPEIDIGKLMMTDIFDYLQFVAPNCTEEEYLVFEQMITDNEDDDDGVINELCELTALEKQPKSKGRRRNQIGREEEHARYERITLSKLDG